VTDFTELVDLAAARLGGMVVAANDEFFAPADNLLHPDPPVWIEGKYTDRGKWMDGWETRRRRTPGHDWCLIRLGLPGIIRGVVIDTTHFTGNYPEACSIDGYDLTDHDPLPDAAPPPPAPGNSAHDVRSFRNTGNPAPDVRERADGGPAVAADMPPPAPAADMSPPVPAAAAGDMPPPAAAAAAGMKPSAPRAGILGETPLEGNSVHVVSVDNPHRVTHVRFNIYPDGGVARLRVHGEVVPDDLAGEIDLAAVRNGGLVVDASGEYYGQRHNLVMPGQAQHMGDGWETRRRRGPGHDWAVIRLAGRGVISRAEVDTSHFKGNYPDTCSLEVRDEDHQWHEVLGRMKLQPHRHHVFDVADAPPATHARLNIYPDGGVARLRLWGSLDPEGTRDLRLRSLNALLPQKAEAELLRCCGSTAWARAMTARRPFRDQPALLAAADEIWRALAPHDWLEAFAAHPRIGERKADRWAMQEQADTATAGQDTLTALDEANRAYEDRFGYLFIVCATGKSTAEMLALLRERLDNTDETELQVAAEEQRKITALRLEKLLQAR
jgi:allantoicase